MEKLKTGFISLDALTGGLPCGKICQVIDHGLATGKTSLALSISSNVIKQGGTVLYFSLEDIITKRISENFGIDSEFFGVCRIGDDEEITKIALEISPTLLIIDSISSVGISEDWKYSSISSFCRRLTEASPTSSFLFLNQERMSRYKKSYTGGRFLDKWLSMSFDLRPLGFIIKNSSPIGNFVSLSIRRIRPWGLRSSIRMRMDFSTGFSVMENLILYGLQTKILVRKGSSIWWNKMNIGTGENLSCEDIKALEEEINGKETYKSPGAGERIIE